MTCIVGLIAYGRVWMGGDSALISGWDLRILRQPKVFKRGEFLFGVAGSWRMGQLLQYALTVETRPPEMAIDEFMVTKFIDAVRIAFKAGGYAQRKDEQEQHEGMFLVGYQGCIYAVWGDYQIATTRHPFEAVGSGDSFALGSLHTSQFTDMGAEDRVLLALRAAEAFSTGVRGPFTVDILGDEQTNEPEVPAPA